MREAAERIIRHRVTDGPGGRVRAWMDGRQREVIAACAQVLLPSGGTIAPSGEEAGVVRYFERVLDRLPPPTRLLVRQLVWFVEFSPWLLGPLKAPMTRLSYDQRRRAILALASSRAYLFRTAFVALRTLLTIAYFADEDVLRAVGAVANADPFGRGEVGA